MRKLWLLMNISLDGRFEDANHDLSWATNDFEAFSHGKGDEVDALLFGRKTYEGMLFWSTPQAQAMMPDVATFMNEKPKFVISHTSFDPGWSNVTVISQNVTDEVRKLKEHGDGSIAVFGSNTLCLSLMQEGLIDEFQILLNPVVLGEGTSLFTGLPTKTMLTLQDTHQFTSGTVMLTYVPTAT